MQLRDARAYPRSRAEEEAAGKSVNLLAVDAHDERVAEKAGFTDTGGPVAAQRSDTDEPVYAVYTWSAS